MSEPRFTDRAELDRAFAELDVHLREQEALDPTIAPTCRAQRIVMRAFAEWLSGELERGSPHADIQHAVCATCANFISSRASTIAANGGAPAPVATERMMRTITGMLQSLADGNEIDNVRSVKTMPGGRA